MYFFDAHPEQKLNEVFIGNYDLHDIESLDYKNIRVGIIAYDICGNEIPVLCPVFVNKDEYIGKSLDSEREKKMRIKEANMQHVDLVIRCLVNK